ncbi:hypothetical protein ACSQ67_023986 [Phaseolus vulgaris]
MVLHVATHTKCLVLFAVAVVLHACTKVLDAVYGPKVGTKKNENPEKTSVEIIWKPQNGQIGKVEKEYEMLLKKTLESICIRTIYPNTTTTVIVRASFVLRIRNVVVHDDECYYETPKCNNMLAKNHFGVYINDKQFYTVKVPRIFFENYVIDNSTEVIMQLGERSWNVKLDSYHYETPKCNNMLAKNHFGVYINDKQLYTVKVSRIFFENHGIANSTQVILQLGERSWNVKLDPYCRFTKKVPRIFFENHGIANSTEVILQLGERSWNVKLDS